MSATAILKYVGNKNYENLAELEVVINEMKALKGINL
jgi:hypothetical protein